MKRIKFNLQWKLTLSFLAVVVLAIIIVGLSVNSYVPRHFQAFCVSSEIVPSRCLKSGPGQIFLANIYRSLIWIGIFGSLISLSLGYFLSKLILNPLQKTMKAAKRFSEGNYKERINVSTNDEINDLIKTLNEMFLKLENLEKMRKDLVANLSHELSTPLTNIYGYLEAINDRVITDEAERNRAIYLVQKETERLISLTRAVKKLALLESDNFSLSLEEVNLNKIIKKTIEKFALKIKQKNINLREDFDSKLPLVKIDPEKIEQVISNLLDNAIKYSGDRGMIELKTWQKAEQIALSVKDSGAGIPQEDLPFIFERFYRADKSRTKKDDSVGIGLTIAKKIIEAHKGNIEVKGKQNNGSEFIVYLPIYPNNNT